MFTLKNIPQSKQQLLASSFTFYVQTFKTLIPYCLLCAFFIALPQFFLLSPFQAWDEVRELTSVIAISWILALTTLSAMIFRLYCFCYHIPSSFWRSFKHALPKLLPTLMLCALFALVIMGATMMLIIPGIIFTVSLGFSFILLNTGNHNILQALITSHQLVWGHWWHTLSLMGFAFLLSSLLLLITFLCGNYLLDPSGEKLISFYWIFSLLNILLQSFLIPFSICLALVLMHDLRQRAITLPRW